MGISSFLVRLAFATIITEIGTQTYEIDLYIVGDSDYENPVIQNVSNNCTNLEEELFGRVSGTRVNQSCTQFYDDSNCYGNSIEISPLSPFQNSFKDWNFEYKTKSVGACKDSCIPEEGMSVSEEAAARSIEIKLDLKNSLFEPGSSVEISVSNCTEVLHYNFQELYRYAFVSLVIPEGECVLAFLRDFSDVDSKNTEDCVVGINGSNVLEFRHGMPHLDNLRSWPIFSTQKKLVKAFSPCQCKPLTNSTPVEEKSFLMLFRQSNFSGDNIKIPLNFEGCLNLDGDNYYWDSSAMSMNVSNGSCLELYKDNNCKDLELTSKMKDRNFVNFTFERKIGIRSLRVCNEYEEETTTPRWETTTPEKETTTTEDVLIDQDKPDTYISEYNWKSLPMYSLLSVACFCASLAFVLTLLLIRNRKKTKKLSQKSSQEKLTDKEINEFLQGLGLQLEEGESNNGNNELMEVHDNPISKLSSDLLAQNQPYNGNLEIPLSQLKFDGKYPIGSGEFGSVFKGTLERSDDESITVAIKTPKLNSNTGYLRALLKEIKIMMYVGHHSKIVALIGCSTVNLRENEILILLEFCERGSLENFLKANQSGFVNFVQRGQLQIPNRDANLDNDLVCQTTNLSYVSVLPSLHSSTQPECSTFDIRQLLTWSISIAEGMEYLSMKKVIHGDLSARNILLTSNLTAKVSDFGLSRKIYCYSPYTRNGEEPLPWRWLALESLKNLEFSTASDVWSFGILLWEIFTLGEQPYPGVSSLTNNFILNLEQGLRPVLPPLATCDIYNIMSCCWNENPTLRPTFSRLNSSFQEVQHVYQNQLSSETVTSL